MEQALDNADRPVATTGHSPDLMWWWDGGAWRPAFSSDGQWWWDGRQWLGRLPTGRHRSRLPGLAVTLAGVLWLALLGLLLPITEVFAGASATSSLTEQKFSAVIAGMAGVAIVATLVWGALLGYRRVWWLLLASASIGTWILAFGYVFSMIVLADPADPTSDNGAAVGLIILGVPAFVVVTLLLVVGGTVGEVLRFLRQHVGRLSRQTEGSNP